MSQGIKMEKPDESNAKKKMRKKVKASFIMERKGWTAFQRKKLLSLLYEYPLDAYKSMARKINGKDEEQVKEFIMKIKTQLKNRHIPNKVKKRVLPVKKSPLDEWLEVATDMVDYESVDNSTNLSKVLSIISHFEDFETGHTEDGPHYKSIYKYLSQISQTERPDDLECLGPLESAIVLDLFHGLMEVLSEYDTTVQRNIMKWKYQLIDARDGYGHSYPEFLKRASENDFTEFIEEARMLRHKDKLKEKRYMNRRMRAEKDKGDKSSDVPTKRKRSEPTSTVTSPENSTHKVSTSNLKVPNHSADANTETEDEVGTAAGTIDEKPAIKRHKPGRKGVLDKPEVPYTEIVLVMPPKGVEIVNFNPRTKKGAKERTDGKYQPLNPEEELINNDFSREITYDVHRTELNQFMNVKPKDEQVPERTVDIEEKYDPMMKKFEERGNNVPVKKPKLYSINPFCLPVTLIDLKFNSNLP